MVKSILYTIIAIVLLLGAAVAWRMYTESTKPVPTPTEKTPAELRAVYDQNYNLGMQHRESGDYISAADAFELAIQTAVDNDTKATAERRAGISNFLTNEPSKQSEGIEQLKAGVESATNPFVKAVVITDLASIVCGNGCDAAIYEQVFSGQPYSQFRHDGDMTRSVTDLYEWSMTFEKVPDAYVRAATWYADQLLLNAENLTEEQKTEYVTILDSYLSEAQQLTDRLRSGARSEISFYFWTGYGYGALTSVDKEKYGKLFEDNYKRAISLGLLEPAGTNKNYAVLFAHYQYAALLDYLYGDERSTDVAAQLQAVITSVKNDPTPDNNQFLAMARNELSLPGLQHAFIGSSLSRLAAKHAEFKTFLESHGLATE